MTQQDVLELMSKRKEIENQIHQQEAILRSNNITLKEPLIDKEGFPIPDVDLYTVRDARANLIRLGNDYKAITKEIELGLHSIHGQQPMMTPQLAIVPFARCDAIEPSSPAYLDGLRTGDALLEFGHVSSATPAPLDELARSIKNMENVSTRVSVKRNDQTVIIMLIPRTWSGRGLLGAHFVPFVQ